MEDKLNVPDMNVGDMISKKAAMERLMAQNVIMDGSEYHNGFNAGVNRAQEVIRNLPTVQPKHGHWVHDDSTCYCSECKKRAHKDYNKWDVFSPGVWILSNFCPDCGADMREVRKDGAD